MAVTKSVKRKPTTKRRAVDPTERLLRKARELGVKSFVVMPIDEIQLGFKLSKRPRDAVLPKLLTLARDNNMHARRIALSALRHMEAWDDPRVLDLFVSSLEDPEGWCRYDAAWALGDSGTRKPLALAGLRKLARGSQGNPDLSDGDARAKSQAAESLAKLTTK